MDAELRERFLRAPAVVKGIEELTKARYRPGDISIHVLSSSSSTGGIFGSGLAASIYMPAARCIG